MDKQTLFKELMVEILRLHVRFLCDSSPSQKLKSPHLTYMKGNSFCLELRSDSYLEWVVTFPQMGSEHYSISSGYGYLLHCRLSLHFYGFDGITALLHQIKSTFSKWKPFLASLFILKAFKRPNKVNCVPELSYKSLVLCFNIRISKVSRKFAWPISGFPSKKINVLKYSWRRNRSKLMSEASPIVNIFPSCIA